MSELQYSSYPLGQDFNKLYSDIVNCKIVPPPYFQWEVPHTFFLNKRDGFAKKYEGANFNAIGFTEIYDIEEYGTDYLYMIGKIGTTIHVKRYKISTDTVVTIRSSQTYKAWVNYKFLYVNTAKWITNTSWTNISANVGEQTIGTGFATTGLDGKFIYLYQKNAAATAPGWIWQVFKIDYSTGGKLNVASTGWIAAPSQCDYKIYDGFWSTLAFIDTDNIMVIHDYEDIAATPDDLIPVPGVPSPLDAIYENNRLYIVQQPLVAGSPSSNVYVGNVGYFSLYYGGRSLIGSSLSVFNITAFQNYILVLNSKGIDVILTVSTNVSGTVYTFEVLSTMTRDIAIYAQNYFLIYNQGFYIISNNKRFLSVTITPQPNDKYTITLTPQGMYIQKFLDAIVSTDKVRFWVYDQDIYILHWNGTFTNMFVYKNFYQGWIRWTTNLFLNWFKLGKYFGTNIYYSTPTATVDWWSVGYSQNIQIVGGEDNIFQVKRMFFTKLIIGNNTTPATEVVHSSYIGWYSDKYSIALSGAKYFDYLAGSNDEELYSDSLVGISEYYSGNRWLAWISPLCIVEIPTWFFTNMDIIEITWSNTDIIHFGWLLTGYELLEPQVTDTENTLSYS